MFVEGKVIDLTRRKVEPKKGQDFDAFEQVVVLIKEKPDRNPEKITCDPKLLNGIEIGKSAKIPVYVRMFGGNGKAIGYELRQSKD